jgi:hypothetical protein
MLLNRQRELVRNNYNSDVRLPYLEKGLIVNNLSNDLFDYIEKLKQYIIDETEKSIVKDTATLRYAISIENYIIPTQIMIGDDKLKQKNGSCVTRIRTSNFNNNKRCDYLHPYNQS